MTGRKIHRIASAALLGIGILTLVGHGYQRLMARLDRADYPAPGTLVTVDDRIMHIDCRGSGAPTLILEAGLTGDSTGWYLVHDALAATTRTCAYDRAGLGWSEPADEPIRADVVAQRLAGLLAGADITGPKVMVGMSAGGIFMREFYQRYPGDVVGMAFIDSSHEQQAHRLTLLTSDGPRQALQACRLLLPIGIARAFSLLDPIVFYTSVPGEMGAMLEANAYQGHVCNTMLNEVLGFDQEIRDREPPSNLGDLPLLVISRGEPPKAEELLGWTLEESIAMTAIWDDLQRELAALSTRSTHLIARESGHMVHLDQPAIVISGLRDFVADLRAMDPGS